MSQELVDQSHELSREGKTYAQIAERFNRNRVAWEDAPRIWTRSDVEKLMNHGTPDYEAKRTTTTTKPAAVASTPASGKFVGASSFGTASFVSTSLKWFGGVALGFSVILAIATSGGTYASDGEKFIAVAAMLGVGFTSLILWFSVAVIIDLLRDIARSSGDLRDRNYR